MPPRRLGPALALIIPLALAAAGSARVLHGEWVFDDLKTGAALPAHRDLGALLLQSWDAFWRGGRPLADLTFALNLRAGALDPWGFHAVNVALHLAAAVILWRLALAALELAGLARARWLAVAVAGLWVVHPLQSQAVSYVTQRSEVLASLLMGASLLAFLRADREGLGRRALPSLAAGLVALALALASKAVAVTVPALWALLAWALPGPAPARPAGPGWRRRALALSLPAGLAIAQGVAVVRSLRPEARAGFELPGLGPWTYLLSQLGAVATYLRLVLWPAGQSVDWAVEPSRSLAEPAVLAAGLLLLALAGGAAALVILGRRRGGEAWAAARVAGAGVLWFLVVLAPTSSVVPLADLVVEHRAYLASWGVLLALVAAADLAVARLGWAPAPRLAGAAVVALWLALAAALHARNAVWETGLALWSDAASKGGGTWRAHLTVGVERERRGDVEGALAAYRTALARARAPGEEAQALHNLGRLLMGAGREAEAEAAFLQAAARPDAPAEVTYALAFLAERRGDVDGAARWAERTLAAAPAHGGALQLLGMLRVQAGRADDGLALLWRAVQLAPGAPGPLLLLGVGLDRAGRAAEACGPWRAALSVEPSPDGRARLEERLAAAGCPR